MTDIEAADAYVMGPIQADAAVIAASPQGQWLDMAPDGSVPQYVVVTRTVMRTVTTGDSPDGGHGGMWLQTDLQYTVRGVVFGNASDGGLDLAIFNALGGYTNVGSEANGYRIDLQRVRPLAVPLRVDAARKYRNVGGIYAVSVRRLQ